MISRRSLVSPARLCLFSLALLATPAGLHAAVGRETGETGETGETAVASPGGAPDPVHIRALWPADGAHPGDQIVLGIVITIDPGFHINADHGQQGAIGDFEPYPTSVRVIEASETLTLESVRFPRAHAVRAEYVQGELLAYSGETVLYLPMKIDAAAAPGTDLRVRAEVDYQTCDARMCFLPRQTPVEAVLRVLGPREAAVPQETARFAGFAASGKGGDGGHVGFDLFGWSFGVDASSGLGRMALFVLAALGGFLLNFTPCVLPVIPIKIMSLANTAGNRTRCFTLGAAMSLGVVVFWLGLAGLVGAARGFTATNQLFQYPAFTITVGLVIALMAVAMTGALFVRLPGFVYALNPSQETHAGSFGLGIMTAILSTPCTAPFMGAAAAWAAAQPVPVTLGTFGAIGAGMAFPYFVLSAFPRLVRRMPRSGPAGDLIKQVMAFLMLAAAAYFVGVGISALATRAPDPPSTLYWWAVMVLAALGGIWLLVRTLRITRRAAPRIVFGGLGALIAAVSLMGAVRLTNDGPIEWVNYTPERFSEALGQNKVVVMDFTAEWCLNCKSLEHGVLHSPRITHLLAEPDVVPIKVDITGNNPAGKARLKEAGRLTIPLLVVYAPDGREIFKSDFYTADQVLEAVQAARSGREYAPGVGG